MKKITGYLLILALFWWCGCSGKDAVSYELSSASEAGSQVESSRQEEGQEDSTDLTGENPENPGSVFVYICGAVQQPGVYELPEGSRIYEAVAAAGGLQENADERSLNQAALLSDGQQIIVYTKEEAAAAGEAGSAATPAESGKVNLNTAGSEQLMTLPGIGEAKAKAILNYRELHGGFTDIEEIKNIEGIKEKVFEKIKEQIEV